MYTPSKMPVSMIQGAAAGSAYAPLSVLAIAQREGEDAKITGMTRSLSRRLLALNVAGSRRPVRRVSQALLAPMLPQRIA